jgi:hypothetical protein
MNAEPMFLTSDEVCALTGFRLPSRQVSWLRLKGWRFEINSNRQPIVARKYAEKMLGCMTQDQPTYQPNFGSLRGA